MTIQAIPTRYKGYHFRSRLEARWAVFFDAIGWKWEYEPQGFALGDGIRYLPDFRLNNDVWVEVKAVPLTPAEEEKARRLCRLTKTSVVIAVGAPDALEITHLRCFAWVDAYIPLGETDLFAEGIPLRKEEVEHGGSVRECDVSLSQYCLVKWGRPGYCMGGDGVEQEDMNAVNAARSARFEHGECGAT